MVGSDWQVAGCAGCAGPSGGLGRIVFSPDGKAATSVGVEGGNRDIWIHDLLRGLATRFTFDPGNDDDGVWSPDGKTIVFDSNRKGVFDLYVKAVDGPAGSEQLLYADNLSKYPMSFSPDGKYLSYFSMGDPKTGADIWVLPDPLGPPGTSKPFPFLQTERNEVFPMFSPDGKWIAYDADESGRREIYVAPFPGPGGRRRVSVSGGVLPRWKGDGTELFYRAPDGNLMVAAIASKGAQLDVVKVSRLLGGTAGFFYDVSPDGQQLLALIRPEGSADRTLTVVQNWTAGLKQ